mmetsp:Transcript_8394/g.15252  ORF Transcript_8394/g.15252 Transcript_8394/m.15252 type:complete len:177 (-) Transcript_8394:271-801(-)|eukprot:CAMPEP_0201883822 /NCGR_PEP_ID=MMETSP0902-20130614/16258_1 /ASSEMBLY_ACC=CAM_ASM_000551 /TAXON_ID=420261 /ORGANISM="Thalassiosira antarctica, Strain CCMP982" /LENGTH=176 /DNA_ID=CAMNT_0048412687 /DNA_START=11 /DNA_END=541 /DNA_ORIENTATION=-
MKLSILTIAASAATLSQTHAFSTPAPCTTISRTQQSQQSSSCLNMFSGGALDVEEEEDDEKRAQIEQMSKAMGMSVEEYQLGMNARLRMEDNINELRVVGGEESTGVTVERDGNMPPRHLVVTVTEEGKAMGKDRLEKAIVDALKDANEKSKEGRDGAQKEMMVYISDSMKKMGAM